MANDYRQSLAQSLMVPTGGGMNPIAAFLRPIMGAGIARAQEKKEREARRSETTALGRLLSAAERARSKGGDPVQAMSALIEANPDEPGYGEAGRLIMEKRLAGALSPRDRKTATDVTGRRRYLDTGEPAFPGVEAPKEPPQTRKFEQAGEIVTQEWDPESGAYIEIARSPKKAGVEVNMPRNVTEVEATTSAILENRRKHEETGDPKYAEIADRLEMKQAFGGKPPESYIKARNSVQQAREGISETYNLISRGQANPLKPADRAKVAQSINKARLAYADMLNRGANFTETEQAMIDAMLGGDPNDIAMRALRGDESYLQALQNAGEALERRGQGLLKSFTSPGVGEFTYPWQQGGGPVEAGAPAPAPPIPGAGPPMEAGMGAGGAAPPSGYAATAVNPNTGEVIVWDGSKWVPQ